MPSSSPTVRRTRTVLRSIQLSTGPTIRKTVGNSTATPDSKQYNKDRDLKDKLKAELRDPATTMDAQTSAEKLRQYLTLDLQTLEYQIMWTEANLNSMPTARTRSDIEARNHDRLSFGEVLPMSCYKEEQGCWTFRVSKSSHYFSSG